MPSRLSRPIAISALLGTAILVSPLAAHASDTAPPAAATQAAVPANPAAASTSEAPRETVEQRITALHASLKITPREETRWNGVARVMRENAAVMEKLMAEKSARNPESVTAVEDLKTYEEFALAHVRGLKTLRSSFETLYKTMPDEQKKVADQVFSRSAHHDAGSHS